MNQDTYDQIFVALILTPIAALLWLAVWAAVKKLREP